MMFKGSSDLGEPAKFWELCQVFAEGNPFCLVWRSTYHPLCIIEKITRLERVVQAHTAQEEALVLRSG